MNIIPRFLVTQASKVRRRYFPTQAELIRAAENSVYHFSGQLNRRGYSSVIESREDNGVRMFDLLVGGIRDGRPVDVPFRVTRHPSAATLNVAVLSSRRLNMCPRTKAVFDAVVGPMQDYDYETADKWRERFVGLVQGAMQPIHPRGRWPH